MLQLTTTLMHSFTIGSYETNSARGRRRLAQRDATGEFGIEHIDCTMKAAASTGEFFLEILERLPRRREFVVVQLRYCHDHRRANPGVENCGERADDGLRGIEFLIEAPRAGCAHALTHQVGEAADEFSEVAAGTVGPSRCFLAEQVEAALSEPPNEGRPVLEFGALGTHRPNLLDRGVGETTHIGRLKDALQVANHGGMSGKWVAGVFEQVLRGVQYIHTQFRMSHNDLKPENVRGAGRASVAAALLDAAPRLRREYG